MDSKHFSNILDPNSPDFFDDLSKTLSDILTDQKHPLFHSKELLHRTLLSFQKVLQKLETQIINAKNCDVVRVLRRGCFSDKHLVRHKISHRLMTMTVIQKNIFRERNINDLRFCEDRNLISMAGSHWIVPNYGTFVDYTNLYICMEYMPGGDLVTWLTNNEDITEDQAAFYTAEIVLGLEALHSMGFIHRDVKPENILVDRDGHLKLADFGTCVRLGPEGFVQTSSTIGTPDYISPEVLFCQEKSGKIGPQCDWWAVGIVLFEMLYGETAFHGDNLAVTYGRIMTHNISLVFPDNVVVSKEAKDIIKRLLTDVDTRLGSNGPSEVKTHPFFKRDSWNWNTIRKVVPPFVPEIVFDLPMNDLESFHSKNYYKLEDSLESVESENLEFAEFSYQNDNFENNGFSNQTGLDTSDDVHNLQKENEAVPNHDLSSNGIIFERQQALRQLEIKKLEQKLTLLDTENIRFAEQRKQVKRALLEVSGDILHSSQSSAEQIIDDTNSVFDNEELSPFATSPILPESEKSFLIQQHSTKCQLIQGHKKIVESNSALHDLELRLKSATYQIESLQEDKQFLNKQLTVLKNHDERIENMYFKCENICFSTTMELKSNEKSLKSLLTHLANEVKVRKLHIQEIAALKDSVATLEIKLATESDLHQAQICEHMDKSKDLVKQLEEKSLNLSAAISKLTELTTTVEVETEIRKVAETNLKRADIIIDDLYRQINKNNCSIRPRMMSAADSNNLQAVVDIYRPNHGKHRSSCWISNYAVLKTQSVQFHTLREDFELGKVPTLEITLSRIVLVREVNRNRIDLKNVSVEDLNRIFQIIYYPSMEYFQERSRTDSGGIISCQGHAFQTMRFRTSTLCHACNRVCSDMFNPPAALECTNCHIKVHYDHVDKHQRIVACTDASKIQLVRVASAIEKQVWIARFIQLKQDIEGNTELSTSQFSRIEVSL